MSLPWASAKTKIAEVSFLMTVIGVTNRAVVIIGISPKLPGGERTVDGAIRQAPAFVSAYSAFADPAPATNPIVNGS